LHVAVDADHIARDEHLLDALNVAGYCGRGMDSVGEADS
jgi:hypothetical protein